MIQIINYVTTDSLQIFHIMRIINLLLIFLTLVLRDVIGDLVDSKLSEPAFHLLPAQD